VVNPLEVAGFGLSMQWRDRAATYWLSALVKRVKRLDFSSLACGFDSRF
ncbi:unnamed protein product, partial [Acidithrix sp. C25]